jgi:putative flippase GtrA
MENSNLEMSKVRRDPWTVVRFGAVGLTANALGYVVFAFCIRLAVQYPAAMVFGYVTTSALGYVMHRSQTFRSRQSHSTGAPRYLAVQLAGLLINYVLLRALVDALQIEPLAAQVICIFQCYTCSLF